MICALPVLCNFTACRKNMKKITIIPLLGVLMYLSQTAWSSQTKTPNPVRSRRSFGISNPIFSRVFNPYDNRPLAQKFFGYDNPQPVQYDTPQYYPLWERRPVLKEEDYEEDHPHPSRPYPPPSKPYPGHSQPYPEPTKPYPNPCPEPTKPYPGAQKPHQRPAFGRLFVDEVDKNLHFERDPKTGELVPVITEGRRSKTGKNQFLTDLIDLVNPGNQNQRNRYQKPFEEDKETERTTTVKAVIEDKTERENHFKLLPNYDIKTKFNEKTDTNFGASRKPEVEDQKVLSLEDKKRKIVREFYGSDETKWPQNPFDTLVEELKTPKKTKNCTKTTTTKTITQFLFQHEPKFIASSTLPPSFILVNQEVPQVFIPKTTKKPCLNKTTKRPFQYRFPQVTAKPAKLNIRVKVSNATKPSPFSFRITPNTPEDYSQFLAPPASVIYQKFSPVEASLEPFTSPSPTGIISHLSKNDQRVTSYTAFQTSRPNGLEFKVFNNKLNQSVLDSLKDPETGKLDPSKLEGITHSVFVEPKRKGYNLRKQLQTLDSRKLNVFNEYLSENNDRYDFDPEPLSIFESPGPKSPFGDRRIASKPEFFGNGRFFWKKIGDEKSKYLEQDLNRKNIFNIGDIPLDKQEIWDGDKRVLVDSYGKKTSTK